MVAWNRFDGALHRCFTEIEIVKAERIVHMQLRTLAPSCRDIRSGFLGIVNASLTFSSQGGLALVLETATSKGRSGFWWLHSVACRQLPGYDFKPSEIAWLREVSAGLKSIRDNTLFHIGEAALQNPRSIRANSGVTYTKFDRAVALTSAALEKMLDIRRQSANWTRKQQHVLPLVYDGSDVGSFVGHQIGCGGLGQ
jgi:hypothetical protein